MVHHSHEVVVSLFLSFETISSILIVIVIISSSHNICNHSHVVVSSVIVSHSLAALSWLLLGLGGFLFVIQLSVVDGLKMIGNLFDLLRIAVLWQIFAQLFIESLNSHRE